MFRYVFPAAALIAITQPAYAIEYKIDPAHSNVQFSVRHMMVSNVKGEFAAVSGTVEWDPKNPEATKIEAEIGAESINTRVDKRDAHLRDKDFLDSKKFPHLVFKSKKVEREADGSLAVTGDLKIKDVSKEVVLSVAAPSNEIVDFDGNKRIGTSATAKLNRKDFGITWNKALETGGVAVGDEIAVTIDVEVVNEVPKAKK